MTKKKEDPFSTKKKNDLLCTTKKKTINLCRAPNIDIAQEKIAHRAGTKISLLVMPQNGGIWANVPYR